MRPKGSIVASIQTSVMVHHAVQPILCLHGFVVPGPVFWLQERWVVLHEVVLRAPGAYYVGGEVQEEGEFYLCVVFAFLVTHLLESSELEHEVLWSLVELHFLFGKFEILALGTENLVAFNQGLRFLHLIKTLLKGITLIGSRLRPLPIIIMPRSLFIPGVRFIRVEAIIRILGIFHLEFCLVVAFLQQFGDICVRGYFSTVLVG